MNSHTQTTMSAHPVCALFPLMDETELLRLQQDIEQNGLRVPLLTYEGMIIDGRNRQLACQRANVELRYEKWDGIGSLVSFAWSMNGARRHLTSSQKAAIAVEMLPMLEEEAARRYQATVGRPNKSSQRVDSISPNHNSGADQRGSWVQGVVSSRRLPFGQVTPGAHCCPGVRPHGDSRDGARRHRG